MLYAYHQRTLIYKNFPCAHDTSYSFIDNSPVFEFYLLAGVLVGREEKTQCVSLPPASQHPRF